MVLIKTTQLRYLAFNILLLLPLIELQVLRRAVYVPLQSASLLALRWRLLRWLVSHLGVQLQWN